MKTSDAGTEKRGKKEVTLFIPRWMRVIPLVETYPNIAKLISGERIGYSYAYQIITEGEKRGLVKRTQMIGQGRATGLGLILTPKGKRLSEAIIRLREELEGTHGNK